MSAAQHKLFEMLVQSVSESRAQMHEIAWVALGVLLLIALLALCGLWLWISNGGLSAPFALYFAHDPNAAKALRHR